MAQQQDTDTAALKLELEQEETCLKEAIAAITAKYNKRKADDISKDQADEIISEVTEDIGDDAKTKTTHKLEVEEKALSLDQSLNQGDSDEDYTVYDCDDCGKKPKDKVT
jgi:DNA-directed RNA polymerase subunit M/transcription elongation factor TFIIS